MNEARFFMIMGVNLYRIGNLIIIREGGYESGCTVSSAPAPCSPEAEHTLTP